MVEERQQTATQGPMPKAGYQWVLAQHSHLEVLLKQANCNNLSASFELNKKLEMRQPHVGGAQEVLRGQLFGIKTVASRRSY